jgi:hypothetical protein
MSNNREIFYCNNENKSFLKIIQKSTLRNINTRSKTQLTQQKYEDKCLHTGRVGVSPHK